jgi:hypothetical protein
MARSMSLELPRINRVTNPDEFFQLMYERNPETKKNEMIAYLNQRGMLDYELFVMNAIRNYYRRYPNADSVLENSIQEMNGFLNQNIDDNLDFAANDEQFPERVDLGDITQLHVPNNTITRNPIAINTNNVDNRIRNSNNTIILDDTNEFNLPDLGLSIPQSQHQQHPLNTNDEFPPPPFSSTPQVFPNFSPSHLPHPPQYLLDQTTSSPQMPNLNATIPHSTPSIANNNMNQTYIITTNSNHPLLYSEEFNQQEFIEYYTNIFQELIDSNDEHFACPPELNEQQRHLLHKLCEDMHLKHKTIGNYKKKGFICL